MMIGPVTFPAAMRWVFGLQHGIAVARGRGVLELRQPLRPIGPGYLEEGERQLPPERMFAAIEPVKRIPIEFLCLDRVDEFG
ncbi:hypothetical protein ACVI1N_002633 [Sinorhizobium medicae]